MCWKAVRQLLIEKEKIGQEEFEALFQKINRGLKNYTNCTKTSL